jgi:glucose/arabinose dehydrogenase
MFRLGLFLVLMCFAAAGCGGGKEDPPSSPDPGTGGERITGGERLGWNQAASSADELARLRYVAYVDGNRVELAGVQCSPSGSSFQCSSRMPSMSPGSHTIELASFFVEGGTTIEGGRSAPLRVTMAGSTTSADPDNRAPASEQTTADGAQLRLDTMITGVESVTSIAFSEDGFVFVGERSGRIFIAPIDEFQRGGSLASQTPAIELSDVHLAAADAGGLLDIALDPAFARTRIVYALHTVAGRDNGSQFRIARFREVGGRLGERAVLFDDQPASPERPAGAIGFGPDGKFYAAFDDGGSGASRASSYGGKVLRLNADGTTPREQSGPVFAGDYRSPRGFDWHPGSGALWVADVISADAQMLRVNDTGPRLPRTPARANVQLPAGTDAVSIAFSRGTQMSALEGDLIIASGRGQHLLRLRLDNREPTRIISTERLFADVTGPLNTITSGPDGALYVGTDRAVLRIGSSGAR